MKRIIISLIILAVFSTAVSLWWKNGLSPVDPKNKTQVFFVIEKGKSIREIANSLKQKELIRDPVVFFLLVKQLGMEGKIQAGDFRLSPSMSAKEIAELLTVGTIDVWVTIPEGKRAEEIAEILKKEIPTFEPSWRDKLIKYEGYLFPDTYLIAKDSAIDIIIDKLLGNFEAKYAKLPASKNKLSKEDLVIIASMVEREAKFDEDRPLVASVILNRLKIDMPLQIDATIQYALGYQEFQDSWWKRSLTKEDLKLESPYNTYINVGLPPTPISNPGFVVLEAVVSPKNTGFLYYVSDKSGHNHYAKTIEEHNVNIKKYGL